MKHGNLDATAFGPSESQPCIRYVSDWSPIAVVDIEHQARALGFKE